MKYLVCVVCALIAAFVLHTFPQSPVWKLTLIAIPLVVFSRYAADLLAPAREECSEAESSLSR